MKNQRIDSILLTVALPLVFTLASLILACFALAGSTTNKSYLTKINLIEFNITDLNISSVLVTNNSALTNVLSSFELDSSILGLSNIYSFGLWGYCKGNNLPGGQVNFTYCSPPTPLFSFDVFDVFTEELVNYFGHSVLSGNSTSSPVDAIAGEIANIVNSGQISLPGTPEYKLLKIHGVDRMNFTTCLLSILCNLIQMASIILVSFPLKYIRENKNFRIGIQINQTVFGLFSFIILILCAGGCTTMYVNKRNTYNSGYDSYGIGTKLTSPFYILIWASCLFSLLSNVSWIMGTSFDSWYIKRQLAKEKEYPTEKKRSMAI